jgi:hypothetical protein
MTQLLRILVACTSVLTACSFFTSNARSFSLARKSYLNSALTVGDAVIAEVDDIFGSVSDPKVSFLVRNLLMKCYVICILQTHVYVSSHFDR